MSEEATTITVVKAEAASNVVEETVCEEVPEAIETEEVTEEIVAEMDADDEEAIKAGGSGQQQIYIIQTTDGNVPLESAEVVVADDLAVYETVSALEQLSRGQVITTAEGGELIQVYEEVVLPDGTTTGSVMDQFVDVAEVEVGDGRSASPITIGETVTLSSSGTHLIRGSTSDREESPQSEFHICRICNQFIPLTDIAQHNQEHHGTMSELTCTDCGKIFKSKRSLFGHKKEKHSGVTEVHACPECGKTFGRKSNLKAHRESLHYGKKFPCQYCDRVFTNRSSMNQHVKKTHIAIPNALATLTEIEAGKTFQI